VLASATACARPGTPGKLPRFGHKRGLHAQWKYGITLEGFDLRVRNAERLQALLILQDEVRLGLVPHPLRDTRVAVIAIEPGMKTDIEVVTATWALKAVSAKSSSCLERTGFVVYGST
jgi:hypothetical protein